ncbi:hypothetical protein P7K49_024388 [Saguinus oedipus]|uniref:Uncharacterized protein n=1 Tax=Saguinus oedipus TaxID=9490 RepID=A0ABQ9UPE9_SAGOE|nr:hypothetical protein P7K49_024388 [Saguinus oedipus]
MADTGTDGSTLPSPSLADVHCLLPGSTDICVPGQAQLRKARALGSSTMMEPRTLQCWQVSGVISLHAKGIRSRSRELAIGQRAGRGDGLSSQWQDRSEGEGP